MSTTDDRSQNQPEAGPLDGDTLVPHEPDGVSADHRRVARRDFLRKGTAIGVGALAAGGAGSRYVGSPVGNAQAFPPALIPAAAAVGVLAYGEFIAGPDDEDVADSLDWQAHVREYTRAVEDQLIMDQTMASLKRDVQLVPNKAREEAIFRVYEAASDGLSEADAEGAAQDAIDETFTTVQRALIDSWILRKNRADQVRAVLEDAHGDIEDSKMLQFGEYHYDGSAVTDNGPWMPDIVNRQFYPTSYYHSDKSATLFDGSVVSYFGRKNDVEDDDGYTFLLADYTLNDLNPDEKFWTSIYLEKPDPSDYDTVDQDDAIEGDQWVKLLDALSFMEALTDLEDEYSIVSDEVTDIVDTYFQPAQDDEFDLTQMVGPAHLSETASKAEDYQEAAMALRSMGYPMSDQVCTVSIADPDDLDEDGDPVTHERTGRLSWTAHSGNMLTVGSELNPDNIVGSVFFAYNEPQEDGSTVGQTRELNRPFTIESAEGASGVSFEDRTLVEADTQLTSEEIQELFAEHYEANQDATENVHDTATGGGGGLLDGGLNENHIIVIVVAVIAAALLGNG